MPTPAMRDRVPGRQSLKRRLRANILNDDKVRVFGPPGTTAGAYGLAKPDKPMGEPPHRDEWGDSGVYA